jgi:hypothetical protein
MFKYVSLNIACARLTACKVEQQKEHLNPTKLHLHRSPIGRKKCSRFSKITPRSLSQSATHAIAGSAAFISATRQVHRNCHTSLSCSRGSLARERRAIRPRT